MTHSGAMCSRDAQPRTKQGKPEKKTSSVARRSSLLLAGNSNRLALAGPSIVLRVLTTHRKPLQTLTKAAFGMDGTSAGCVCQTSAQHSPCTITSQAGQENQREKAMHGVSSVQQLTGSSRPPPLERDVSQTSPSGTAQQGGPSTLHAAGSSNSCGAQERFRIDKPNVAQRSPSSLICIG